MTEKKSSSKVLWIVLAVLGGIGCLGCAGVVVVMVMMGNIWTRTAASAKSWEAETEGQTLALAVERYCRETGQLPGAAGPVPPTPGGATKQIGDFAADPTFAELGFSIADPVYYTYSLVPAGTDTVRVVVNGDLDEDGTQSTFGWTCGTDCVCRPEPRSDDQLGE